jgi:hypothetical protein
MTRPSRLGNSLAPHLGTHGKPAEFCNRFVVAP